MFKVIVIFADGLGFHYTQNAEFRKSLENICPSVIPIRSLLGYSAGLVSSLWTSSYPEDHGYWVRWMLREDYVPQPIQLDYFKWIMQCLWLYGFKRLQLLLGKSSDLEPAIPKPVKQFFLCKDLDVTKPLLLKNPQSIFSIFEKNSLEYHYSACQKIDDMVCPNDSPYEIVVFHLGEMDTLGHSYGPDAGITLHRSLKLLNAAKKLAKKAEHICLFSDHGMFNIRSRINLLESIGKMRSKLGKDYMTFLDATMARFWFFNENAKKEVDCLLSEAAFGHFLDTHEIMEEGLRFKKNHYGDTTFLMNPSTEIYPNYFHPLYTNFFRGLHGFSPTETNSYALFAGNFDLKKTSGTLLDISPTILKLLNIPPPKDWKGKSLIG